jgi:hypothetical protein
LAALRRAALKLWNKIVKTDENVSQFWTWPGFGRRRTFSPIRFIRATIRR